MPPSPEYTLPVVLDRKDGLFFKVRAVPGAKKEKILGVYGEALRVAVRSPPERGKANKALMELLARELGLRRGAVSIHSGETGRDKTMRIDSISRCDLLERLGKILGGRCLDP